MFEDIIIDTAQGEEPEFLPIISVTDEEEPSQDEKYPEVLPVIALKNTVLFPGVVIPINVGRNKSFKALQESFQKHRYIGVLTQVDSKVEDPGVADLFKIGTIARIIKLLKMPDGSTTAILQGRKRFELGEMVSNDPYLLGKVLPIEYRPLSDQIQFSALVKSMREKSKRIIELSPNIPTESIMMIRNITNNIFLINFIASNLNINISSKQGILEDNDLVSKGSSVLQHMDKELQLLEIKDQIESKTRSDIEKQQRDYFLNQQLKTIQEELGDSGSGMDIEELVRRADKKKWPKHAREAFNKEVSKLRRINPQMAEYSLTLNYVEFLLDLPWEKFSKDSFDLKKVKEVLDKDHHGLEKVKDRILEHLAVLKLKGDMKAPIICLVGPPGVGKTSLGRSVARALKRKFVRMSFGGLHDESEIRGHRKTYIGAMPGRILQSIKRSKTSNPVFILDEIDKIGKDFRGDPSSALLEVLDPEQNDTFYDNYLELEYDLSRVLFIATANSISTIQPALRDRMEIISISGYSTEEKVEIAVKHLIPKQREAHGLKGFGVRISRPVIQYAIMHYTRESGVRALDRVIAAIMRNVAKKVAMDNVTQYTVTKEALVEMLGPEKFQMDLYHEVDIPGVAIGLAWTAVGGDILFVETSQNEGKGKLTLTGNLGDVMKESATTALSFIKANAADLNIDRDRFDKTDIHLHVPEGAIPKDGPSAGITMLTAISSSLSGRRVKPYLAMSGEITLRGKVLPVGGIKEKVLAARRAGIKEIILCAENEKHVKEIKKEYLKGLTFHYVKTMKEVLEIALV
ncbi:MAG: endopeptidase La [Saprospirales bacterium]|nr:MAG: endopeptidase La [Saprospirales bacterium]